VIRRLVEEEEKSNRVAEPSKAKHAASASREMERAEVRDREREESAKT
jgi:hypothetical protein